MRIWDDCLPVVAFLRPSLDRNTPFYGTAFFVRHSGFDFLVTAAHCAHALNTKEFSLRVGTDDVDVRRIDWTFHSDPFVDVAVAPVLRSDLSAIPRDRLHTFASNHFLTSTKVYSKGIGPGDQAHIVGHFRLRPGKNKNTPVVHTGHIAMMPDKDEPLEVKNPRDANGSRGWVQAYLVEAQTLDTLSGSPVFVRRSLSIPYGRVPNSEFMAYGSIWLLGVWHGSWTGKVDDVWSDEMKRSHPPRAALGMGIAVPADKIIETMELVDLTGLAPAAQPTLAKTRSVYLGAGNELGTSAISGPTLTLTAPGASVGGQITAFGPTGPVGASNGATDLVPGLGASTIMEKVERGD